jgi:outer membrane lipoprotein SlyB
MKSLRGQGGDQQFNAAEVIRKLKDDQFYEKAFTAAERKDIEKTLHVLNTAPALPTPSSINAGSKRMNQRIAGATAGAASGAYIGSTVGQPAAGAVIGGLAGFGARDVADMASNLAFAMKTDTGRAMVKELAKTKKGFFTPRNAAVLSAYAAALRNQPDTEMTRE